MTLGFHISSSGFLPINGFVFLSCLLFSLCVGGWSIINQVDGVCL